jgi:hypothetical protein
VIKEAAGVGFRRQCKRFQNYRESLARRAMMHPACTNNSQARSRQFPFTGTLLLRILLSVLPLLLLAPTCLAQFSASLQGTVTDPSSAVVPNATVTLTNVETNQQQNAQTDSTGTYRFESLAPGSYRVQVTAAGFGPQTLPVTLQTQQRAGVNVAMTVGNSSTQVEVNATPQALNTEENRVQTTLDTEQVRTLPLQNRGTLNLVNAAPGVSGYSQNLDNFQNEQTPNASANGHFSGSNLYVIDGIESDSNITGGTNNITPNPDSLREISLQTNTFAVDYAGGAGVTTELTTKSGTNRWHGTGEISYYNQDLQARYFFTSPNSAIQPYRRFEYSGTLGGAIYKDKTFFFASVEKLASLQPNGTSFFANEDPALVALAQQRFPNTIGTRTLTQFPAVGINFQSVRFYTSPDLATQCATPAGTCSVPFIDNVNQTTAPFNNGLQYSLRLDQNFRGGRDRIYAYYFNINHQVQTIDPRPAFSSVTGTFSSLYSINYTHVFSPNLLNEAVFAYKRVSGARDAPEPAIPELSVNNVYGIGANGNPAFGGGFGPGNFAQHQYSWRDVVTFVRGRHDIRVGVQISHGNDSADFAGNYARPSFSFNNGLADFVQDRVYQESGVAYDPLTAQVKPFQFGVQGNNYGVFVSDSWKVRPNLTLQLGLRWDDFGNPQGYKYKTYTFISNTIPATSTKLLGSPSAIDAQFANAAIRTSKNVFNGSLNNNWSPRIGFSWAPTASRRMTIHGGAGLYRDQISLGQVVDQLRGNPPGWVTPNFGQNTGNPIAPIYSFGSSNVYPYGYILPPFQSGSLDAHGGIVGSAAPVQGIDPNVTTPPTLNFTLGGSQQLGYNAVATITYTGSYSWNQLTGTDFNRSAGDLIRNNGTPARLNPSFGSLIYAGNFDQGNYNSVIFALQQRFKRIDYQASYTWSHALDYGTCSTRYVYSNQLDCPPDQHGLGTNYYGSSSFDQPQNFKLSGSYQLPSPNQRLLKIFAGGWQTTHLFVAQSGTPWTAENYNSWGGGADDGGLLVNGRFTTVRAGDYNADGNAQDYPNVDPNIRHKFTHSDYTRVGGVFGRDANGEPIGFTPPVPGTQGNQHRNTFRNPGLFEWDASVLKNNALPWFGGEKSNLQLRVDGFNVINHTNFNTLDYNIGSSTFGEATSSLQPRIIQLGARFEF